MIEPRGNGTWQIAGASVRGANHIRLNLPNQDAAEWLFDPDRATVCLAVADGHGAPMHSRSDRGAKFAVTAAITELQAYAASHGSAGDLAALRQSVLRRWRDAVEADLTSDPLSARESAALSNYRLNASSAYGATLLLAFLGESSGFAIQIGDGFIYLVSRDGAVETALTPPALPGESTHSLCMANALNVMATRIFTAEEVMPLAAVILSTDGYSKSFRTDDLAAAQIKSIADRFAWDSAGTMSRELEGWLQRVSEAGSGDDISLVVAVRRGS
jgi:hypothetical protein